MPELGEVEFARYQFSQYGLNSEITNVILHNDKGEFDNIICECSETELQNVLKKGNKISTSNRKGKQLYFTIVNGKKKVQSLLLHFGMTGSLVWKDKIVPEYKAFSVDKDTWPPKFSKLVINFKNGNSVAYTDPRRIGRIKLRNDPLLEEPLSKLAPDPSIDGIGNKNEISVKMSKISTSIKATLLDQEKLYCGLGNWMCDEILFQSNIHPESVTKNITGEKLDALLDSIKYVSDTAVDCCTQSKAFPKNWLFHYRWDRKLTQLPTGESIKTLKVGGRTSVYIPSKQKLCTSGKDNDTKKKRKIEENSDTDKETKPADKKKRKGK